MIQLCMAGLGRKQADGRHAQDPDIDPLDAFMSAEVLPEVAEKEQEEKQRRQEARDKFAKQVVVR